MTSTYLTYLNIEFPLPLREECYNDIYMEESESESESEFSDEIEYESVFREGIESESYEDPNDDFIIIYRDEEMIDEENLVEEEEKSEKELINYYLAHANVLDEVDPEEQEYLQMEAQREMNC